MITPILSSILSPIYSAIKQGSSSSSSYYDMIIATSPERYYRHGEASGTVLTDDISAKNGSYNVAPSLNQTSLLASGDDKSVNYAASGYGLIPQDADFNIGAVAFTFMFLIKTNTTQNDKFVLDLRQADNTGFVVTTGGYLSTAGVFRYADPTGANVAVSTVNIDDGSIHHCAVVRNAAGLVTLYVDGVADGTVTDTTSYTRTTGNATLARSSFANADLDGWLDEVSWHKSALSDATIAALAAKAL